jgi:hypothetical protein
MRVIKTCARPIVVQPVRESRHSSHASNEPDPVRISSSDYISFAYWTLAITLMKASVRELSPRRITCRPCVKDEMTYDYRVRARDAPERLMAVAVSARVYIKSAACLATSEQQLISVVEITY